LPGAIPRHDGDPVRIENEVFSQGEKLLILKVSVVNKEPSIIREYTLAEQRLTITAPILLKKNRQVHLRVLI
jgi:hypothetical protein